MGGGVSKDRINAGDNGRRLSEILGRRPHSAILARTNSKNLDNFGLKVDFSFVTLFLGKTPIGSVDQDNYLY